MNWVAPDALLAARLDLRVVARRSFPFADEPLKLRERPARSSRSCETV